MQEYILFQEYSVLIFQSEPVCCTCAYNRARTSKLTQNRTTIHEQFCLSEMKQLLAKIVTGYNLSQVVNDVIFWFFTLLRIASRVNAPLVVMSISLC